MLGFEELMKDWPTGLILGKKKLSEKEKKRKKN